MRRSGRLATSKYVDPIATMQVIGCVYNNPSLLDAVDKYNITAEDLKEVCFAHPTYSEGIFEALFGL
jgi:pyruvate/2-oxoglutarate dehydrogenase complex dihydrolipoamide dehydrogenase (E3) component